jgi:Protein of unknown function (DUF3383)
MSANTNLDAIVNVQISATTRTPSAPGFGTALFACAHALNTDRSRTYADLAGISADGFATDDAAYLMAQTAFAQSPRPAQVKIGRRALPFTQVIELTPDAPSPGTTYTVVINGAVVMYTSVSGDTTASVCTALATAINTAVGGENANAIVTTHATATAPLTLNGGALNGSIGGRTMSPMQQIEVVLSASADWLATTATVTGTDFNGTAVSAQLSIPAGGGVTLRTPRRVANVTEIDVPAQGGTGGSFTVGIASLVSATGASGTKVVVTTTMAGRVVSYACDPTNAHLTFHDATTDPGIVTDLTAIALFDGDFYGVALDSNSGAEILAAAPWIEANEYLFAAQTCDGAVPNTNVSSDTTSVAHALVAAAYFRTHLDYIPSIGTTTSWIAAGILGNRLPAVPGSDTWVFKTLVNVASYALTATQITNLKAKLVGYYIVVAGIPITLGGKVAGNEWVDVIRGRDWLISDIQLAVFGLLANNEKVEYTDDGVALVTGAVKGALDDAVAAKYLAKSTANPTTGVLASPWVTAPLVLDVDQTDRANRVLPNVSFGARLAGAIQAVQINGTITA